MNPELRAMKRIIAVLETLPDHERRWVVAVVRDAFALAAVRSGPTRRAE